MKIKWLGQGGYEIVHKGKTLLIDPYISDMVERKHDLKRLVPPPFTAARAKPDYYFATHDHMDHLDTDFVRKMDTGGVTFVGPPSCRDALLALDKGITQAQIICANRGESIRLGEFNVLGSDSPPLCGDIIPSDTPQAAEGGFIMSFVYADHTPDSVGAVISADGISMYFTGDTLYGEQVGAGVSADVLFICINGKWGNMSAAEAVRVAKRVKPEAAVPNHYGMFAENTADPADFTRPAEAEGIRAFVMPHGEWVEIAEILDR